ncbi:MAG: FtsQ-type POTRA domain-containing protein [Ruminococcus sp.]|nr:FtsQ-type POTRA domain-containing protein [Ruminococcus sp.]
MSENGEFNENNSTDTVNDAELKAYVEELKTARMRNLYIGSIFIVLAIILIACLVFFFNIETIQIEGVTLYGDEQIQIVGGVQSGQNLIRLDTDVVEERLKNNLVYIEDVKVQQKLPSTLVITCTEAEKAVDIEDGDSYYVISSSGRVLEQSAKPTGRIPVIKGFELKSKTPGEELASKDSLKTDILSQLLTGIQDNHYKRITNIDMSDRSDIKILYDERIEIRLGSSVDIESKLTQIKAVIDRQREDYEGTVIYNSIESGISAIPKEKNTPVIADTADENSSAAEDDTSQAQTDTQEEFPADNNTDGWQDENNWQTDDGTAQNDGWQDGTADNTWQDNTTDNTWQDNGGDTWQTDYTDQGW